MRVDERCIEYPWMLAQLPGGPGNLLDAGSGLNHGFLLKHPRLRIKQIDILTLAPEPECFWRLGVSYLYHDVRSVPIRDDFYDAVTCISTLDHVGFDNSYYTGTQATSERRRDDFMQVVPELRRVLKANGTLLLTVPFGRRQEVAGFRQFDRTLLSLAIDAFGPASHVEVAYYRYTFSGWVLSSAPECDGSQYAVPVANLAASGPSTFANEPDGAAAARAVACVALTKL